MSTGKVIPMPGRAEISPESIPAELKSRDRWLLWKYEQVLNADGLRYTKPPYQTNGKRGNHSNADTWTSFDAVMTTLRDSNLFHGIGYVMGEPADLYAWDLDHVLNPKTVELVDWAEELVNSLASYAEITPSGEGVRIFCRGSLPESRRKNLRGLKDFKGGQEGGAECYNSVRYVTLTGLHWPRSPMEIRQVDDLEAIWKTVFEKQPGNLTRLLKSDSFTKLWQGAWADVVKPDGQRAYGSQSEADLALTRQLLISCEGDVESVDRMFRQSGLMRKKWDERGHFADTPQMTYGEHTVQTGLASYQRTFNLTDVGNAKRFAKILGDRVRYCQGVWYVWNGKILEPDRLQRIYVLSDEVAKELVEISQEVADEDRRKAILKHARALESRGQVESMLRLAQARAPLPVLPDQLDASDDALVCRNGTLWYGSQLRPHKFEDLMTKMSPFDYAPRAQARRWTTFLEEIMPDEEVRHFLQKAVGYSMTGSTKHEYFFLAYGTGQNGKSKFFDAIRLVLGEYFTRVPSSAIMLNRGEPHPTGLTVLKGARLALASELKEGRTMNEEVMKAITGEKEIQARRMHQDFETFRSTSKLWIMSNFKPVISGTDLGIWRRVVEIPFTVTIPMERRDDELLQKFEAEAEGILAWCAEGWRAWHEEGLAIPKAIRRATEEYREEMDLVQGFLNEECGEAQGLRVSHADLYAAYVRYSERNGERPMSSKAFSGKLAEKKDDGGRPRFEKYRGTGHALFWAGVSLRESQSGDRRDM